MAQAAIKERWYIKRTVKTGWKIDDGRKYYEATLTTVEAKPGDGWDELTVQFFAHKPTAFLKTLLAQPTDMDAIRAGCKATCTK